ncbi:MAG: aspartate-semialdehyde dehydrogenase [Defluviitaleaceae bacterium]|nr:aspartate-semialdehyde dehydrogenase [Defluviitaleaceae bacterium]MCL2263312.1 aspartate-semialdehyde dehydrogenase [Defluviitaleaceae bacterium]
MKSYKVGILGACGMVGGTMLQVLRERDLPISELYLFDVAAVAGKTFDFKGKTVTVEESTLDIFDRGIDICLFAVDSPISKKYAPIAAEKGCVVVDNSSEWRMDDSVPLVVPEVNGDDIFKNKGIVASPNCSTIQALVAINPLHKAFGIKRVIYSTYQSVAGAGMAGIEDLRRTNNGEKPQCFPYPIAGNVIPRIDVFDETGYTGEETKMIKETRKILHEPNMRVTATTVRVPVEIGHSESINLEFEKPFELDEVRKILQNAPGVILQDNPAKEGYPTPKLIAGTDEVYVGRIRRDFSADNALNIWVVADNVRKGAATNAVQIAERLIKGA